MIARVVNALFLLALMLGTLVFWLCVVEAGRRVR